MSTVKATRGMRTLVGMGLAALLAATPATVQVGGRYGFIVTKTIAVAEDGGNSGRVGILARAAVIMVPTVTGITRVAMEKKQQETMQIRRKTVDAEIRNCVASD